MIKKLRMKFVIINMMIVTVMLGVILGTVFLLTQSNFERERLDMLRNIAMRPSGRPTIGNITTMPGGERVHPYFILNMSSDGTIVVDNPGYFDLSDQTLLKTLVKDCISTDKETGVIKAYSLMYYKAETQSGQRIAFADISSDIQALQTLLRNSSIIGLLSFIVFLGISILLSRWAVKPVETAWQQQRQFVADASHELKTPLTVIMTNVKLAQEKDFSDEDKQGFLQGIETMSVQMKGLVEQLLQLARIDASEAKTEKAYIDMTALISDCALIYEPLFFENNLTLSSDIDEYMYILGQQNSIRQVTEILLDNAKKYSSPGTDVEISLHRHGDNHCLLCVSNKGEQIGKEDLQNIFKRFYRVDTARSRDGSYGLGLSIAQGIVQNHKGKIWAESDNGVNRFCVSLPIK